MLAVPAILGLAVAQASLYDVPGGTRAIIFDRFQGMYSRAAAMLLPCFMLTVIPTSSRRLGVKDQAISEGTHFLVPWLQRAILYDVRIKPRNISTTTGSKGALSLAALRRKLPC